MSDGANHATERRRLPNRRDAEITEFEVGGFRYIATVGRFTDGSPAEIFINTSKTGSELERSTRDAAVLASIGLQYGIPLAVLSHALSRNSRGEPDSALCYVLDQLAKEAAP